MKKIIIPTMYNFLKELIYLEVLESSWTILEIGMDNHGKWLCSFDLTTILMNIKILS